jgi:hypothetical protein
MGEAPSKLVVMEAHQRGGDSTQRGGSSSWRRRSSELWWPMVGPTDQWVEMHEIGRPLGVKPME